MRPPRFESRLRHAAGAIEEARLREQMALMEPEETSARVQRRLAAIREEMGPEVVSDGPLVARQGPAPSIAAGRSRGPGIIDLLPGAQHIIPAIMANLRPQTAAGTGPEKVGPGLAAHRGRAGPAVLGRCADPLSSLLVSGRGCTTPW